ncbi:ATP-binding cassette subfamily C protein LapB [Oceanisphaera litoralis]|uniref:type I secretion system permease/ATPase n=1 Tax=Oceanisphaera litoralis TaxID=225144 RepID=UPI00195B4AF5|nr:type I secretion system permease/ATPase [Oceanisphaera litoralis]MBM7454840.1 ATP-binding cassette subfamily C protein LapB [Oceanisphaera litoralis]
MQDSQSLQDPLLHCLVFLTKLYGHPWQGEALISGLPLPKARLTPLLFSRAAERAGLSSHHATHVLDDISDLLLPCILLLKDGGASVLLETDPEQSRFKVMLPASGEGEQWLSRDKLAASYRGQAIFTKPKFRFDERSPRMLDSHDGHWFWGTLRRSSSIYRDVLAGSLLINIFALVTPLFTMNVYDKIVPNLSFDSLWVLAIGAGIVFLFDFVMRMLRSHFIDVAGKKSDVLLSAQIFSKVMGMRMEARPPSTGAFAKHLQEFESVRDFLTSATVAALVDIPFSLLFLLIIWVFAGYMVWVPVIAMLLLLGFSALVQGPLKRSIEEGARLASQKNANLVEGIAGLETIKLFGAQGAFQHRWEQAVSHIASWGMKTRRLTNSVSTLASVTQQFTTISLIVLGVYLIAAGDLSMGGLIASVMLSGRAIAPMVQLSVLSTRYNQARSAMGILEQIMAAPEEQEAGRRFIHHPVFSGDIRFDRVCFRYPGTEHDVLSKLSLHIKAGEKVAVIGRIGSGKTTLERLVAGLYKPTGGAIRIDGIDIGQLQPATLRRNIGCVPQDVNLFFGTIRDNIVIANPLAEENQVLKAAQRAGVTLFTNQDPDGLDKQVGEGGRQLSGGQRQAVAIARALLSDPVMLMMDEPTSNMDNRSEQYIRQELLKLRAEQTLLLVTHRTSMLEVVDRIVVLEQGRIVADGPKAQVLQQLQSGQVRSREVSNG